ncbi:MAG: competence/damage-inducible protein A [Lentisphaerae bacterium]|nr:competence/damage-inducible protein A [Lentisphaerota bacterium]
MNVVRGFGLFIIGNEILDGRVSDRHFSATRRLLHDWNMQLLYAFILPDDRAVIEDQLRWAFERGDPFFSCGGIGGTPDDLTRGCAASVLGLEVEAHQEALRILENRFGKATTPGRIRMIEFPKGAELIPNPVNQVPGFQLREGFFLPGFPEMAEPMMKWVLETLYAKGDERTSASLRLPGAREADLVPIMEEFIADHPTLSFSSLPRFTDTGTEVILGMSGPPDRVREGLSHLGALLDTHSVAHEWSTG